MMSLNTSGDGVTGKSGNSRPISVRKFFIGSGRRCLFLSEKFKGRKFHIMENWEEIKMKFKLYLFVLLLLGACKGPVGSKGDKGDHGPGSVIYMYEGTVPNNLFNVNTPKVTNNSIVTVSIGDATGHWSELPYYLPGLGYNAYFIARPGFVEIGNALSAGASYYKVQVIPYSVSGFSKLLP